MPLQEAFELAGVSATASAAYAEALRDEDFCCLSDLLDFCHSQRQRLFDVLRTIKVGGTEHGVKLRHCDLMHSRFGDDGGAEAPILVYVKVRVGMKLVVQWRAMGGVDPSATFAALLQAVADISEELTGKGTLQTVPSCSSRTKLAILLHALLAGCGGSYTPC
jgi:hypothetical protein